MPISESLYFNFSSNIWLIASAKLLTFESSVLKVVTILSKPISLSSSFEKSNKSLNDLLEVIIWHFLLISKIGNAECSKIFFSFYLVK